MKGFEKRKEERGAILILALLITFVTLLIAVPFLFKLSGQYRNTNRSFKALSAFNLAEAGVERAIWELNHGDISSWAGDSSLRTLTISSFQVAGGTAAGDIEISVTNPYGETPVVVATGKASYSGDQTVDKTIRVALTRDRPLVVCAVFADERIEFNTNSLFDSYDSREGDYGGPNVGQLGHLGTNATSDGCVHIENAEIYGNIACGPGADPEEAIEIINGAVVYGETYALTELKELPSMPPPVGLPYLGDRTVAGTLTIDQSAEYHDFQLGSNTTVTIAADVTLYVNNNFTMNNNTEIRIAEGASLTIYIGNNFVQNSNSKINNLAKDPTQLLIIGTDSYTVDTNFYSNSQFYGTFYAPNVFLDFKNNYDYFGAVVCKKFKLSTNANFHFDEALTDFSLIEGSEIYYKVKSWQEIIQ